VPFPRKIIRRPAGEGYLTDRQSIVKIEGGGFAFYHEKERGDAKKGEGIFFLFSTGKKGFLFKPSRRVGFPSGEEKAGPD